MGGAPEICKADQNNVVPNVGYNIGHYICFFDFFTRLWRYDMGYDIEANYDIVYNIISDEAKITLLALL